MQTTIQSLETNQTLKDKLMEIDQIAPQISISPQIKDAQKEKIIKIDHKSFSVSELLRKVFNEEFGNERCHDYKLLVITIHVVLLDSGFVSYDDVGRKEINGFPFQNEWPLDLFDLRICYSLPEVLKLDLSKTVFFKFHSLGKSIIVYGCLVNANNNKSTVYRAKFDEEKLVNSLNVVWENRGKLWKILNNFGDAEKEVLEFWIRVKDELVLPMLMDLRENSGLGLPACFVKLPSEIKLKILESLPGDDVARAECVCSELRYLSSNDDLWNEKYAEEFGVAASSGGNWKVKFVTYWKEMRVGACRKWRHNRLFGKHDIWYQASDGRICRKRNHSLI